jgi:hypothetical protein
VKYSLKMGLSAVIYIPSLAEIGSGIQKLVRTGYARTQREWRLHNNSDINNSVALVRERTILTERPPLVGEVSANFCG